MHANAAAVSTRADPASAVVVYGSQRFGPVESTCVAHALSLATRVLPPVHDAEHVHAEHVRPSTSLPKNVAFVVYGPAGHATSPAWRMHVFVPLAGDGLHAEPASHAPMGGFGSAHAVASRANAGAVFAPPVGALHEPTTVRAVLIAFDEPTEQ